MSLSGSGLAPDPQVFTCVAPGTESFTLELISGIELVSPNHLTITSTDKYGNPSVATTTVDVPMDTKGPAVVVSNGGNIVVGQTAFFTITATDINPASSISYDVSISGEETATYTCTTNPCEITTNVISGTGNVFLTVYTNSVADDLGNMGDTVDQTDTIMVHPAKTLAFDTLSLINTLNASSYSVSGVCDPSFSNVDISVGSVVLESVSCTASSRFSTSSIDVSDVSLQPLTLITINVTQGLQTATTSVMNDQVPITTAPVVTVTGVQTNGYSNGMNTVVSVACNEVGEEVSFSGVGLVLRKCIHVQVRL